MRNNEFRENVQKILDKRIIDKTELEEIIMQQRRLIFQSSEEEAQEFVKGLLARESEKRQDIDKLHSRSKELSDKLYLQWKPFLSYILEAFDNRIMGIQKERSGVVFWNRQDEFD